MTNAERISASTNPRRFGNKKVNSGTSYPDKLTTMSQHI